MFKKWLADRRARIDCRVLATMVHDRRWWGGYELGREVKMRPGKLYPALRRLLDYDYIEDMWAELEPGRKHRRRLYRARTIFERIEPNEAST